MFIQWHRESNNSITYNNEYSNGFKPLTVNVNITYFWKYIITVNLKMCGIDDWRQICGKSCLSIIYSDGYPYHYFTYSTAIYL